jgi:arabinogalactan oligomer/maltooligosaccharide transport system substrate-binding protein
VAQIAVSWGDVPGWIEAIATFGALVFAAAAAVSTGRILRLESERDRVASEARREQERRMRRAQAALVSAWWGEVEGRPRSVPGVYVRNASEAPIYQAHLTLVAPDDGHSGYWKTQRLVIPPGEAEHIPVDLAGLAIGADFGNSERRVKLTFTDAAGVRWARDEYGHLVELTPDLYVRADGVRAEALGRFAKDFRATYGVGVSIEAEPGRTRYEIPVIEGSTGIVDAFIGAHDWIGELVQSDVIEPTVLSDDHRAAFPSWTLEALTFDGQLYGLPTTLDTVALIRNTDLAPQPPATFDELVAAGVGLCEKGSTSTPFALRVSEGGDPFQLWPLFTSAGGSLFDRRPGGTWDPDAVTVATEASMSAFERLHQLGEAGLGALRRSVDRQTAFDLFVSEQTAYLVTTADALIPLMEAGLPIEVTAVPPFARGGAATCLAFVDGLMIAKHGPDKAIAHDLFADYLTNARVMTMFSATAMSAPALRAADIASPEVRTYRELCDEAVPMPSFPHMRSVWRLLGAAQAAVIGGAQPHATAKRLAKRISALTDQSRPA